MRRKIMYTLIISCVICTAAACGQKKASEEKDVPIARISGSYYVDPYDPVAVTSSADYAFVGNVVKHKGYEYEDGERPYTNYDIRVIKILKGELKTDIDIPITKRGGMAVDGSCYEVYEDDFLPKEGDVCIFTAYGTEEGELVVIGANSTLLLEMPEDFVSAINGNTEEYIEKVLEKNEEYRTYVDASKNLLPASEVEAIPVDHYKCDYEQ